MAPTRVCQGNSNYTYMYHVNMYEHHLIKAENRFLFSTYYYLLHARVISKFKMICIAL